MLTGTVDNVTAQICIVVTDPPAGTISLFVNF